MKMRSDSFTHRGPIPAEFAFCRMVEGGPPQPSDNRNPHLAWEDPPAGTRSFALWCVDPDVPSRPDDVNQPDRSVPADLPRVEFTHWIMVDLPAELREIAAGALSDGIQARGKPAMPGPGGARQGLNDYSVWFDGDADMGGRYHGYDGPCPPFNDALLHRYFFRLFALDVAQLAVAEDFTAAQALTAMQGHVLDEVAIYGTYTLNPAL